MWTMGALHSMATYRGRGADAPGVDKPVRRGFRESGTRALKERVLRFRFALGSMGRLRPMLHQIIRDTDDILSLTAPVWLAITHR